MARNYRNCSAKKLNHVSAYFFHSIKDFKSIIDEKSTKSEKVSFSDKFYRFFGKILKKKEEIYNTKPCVPHSRNPATPLINSTSYINNMKNKKKEIKFTNDTCIKTKTNDALEKNTKNLRTVFQKICFDQQYEANR